MARINPGRYTANPEGDFVVFLIGMRINRPLRIHKWWPVFVAMPKMIRELEAHPEKGMLRAQFALIRSSVAYVQYWRSFEHLARFARNPDDPHLPAWARFNRAVEASGDVGIWHETYRVAAGECEAIYGNMPSWGLAEAFERVPVGSTVGQSAARRIGAADADDVAIPPYPNPEKGDG
jgi:Domain of unknown function (DUF4188)